MNTHTHSTRTTRTTSLTAHIGSGEMPSTIDWRSSAGSVIASMVTSTPALLRLALALPPQPTPAAVRFPCFDHALASRRMCRQAAVRVCR
jgi:hypothetical protein